MLVFILAIVIATLSPADSTHSYVVTCSDRLIPGIPLQVRVSILTSPGPVAITALIEYANNGTAVANDFKVFHKGVTDFITLQVPINLPKSSYVLKVMATGGLFFRNESSLIYDDNWPLMYIQTDKTRYSAGQEVKFRTIYLQPNLLGYNGDVYVTIRDGKGNKIQVFGPLQPKQGVIQGSLPLSNEPVFGDWSITASARDKSVSKTFTVNDYVLPKFSVSIDTPSDLKRSDSVLSVNVTARFTFNTAVSGKCTLEIYNDGDAFHYFTVSKPIFETAIFDIQMTDITNKGISTYRKLNIRALVTDNATALTVASEKEVKFTNPVFQPTQTVSLQLVGNAHSTVVPGIKYYGTVFVKDNPSRTGGSIQVEPTVRTAELLPCLLNNPPTKWLDVKTTKIQTFHIQFDESGYAPLKFPVALHTENVKLELTYGGVSIILDLDSVPMSSPAILRVSPSRPHGVVGDMISISAESTTNLDGLLLAEVLVGGFVVDTIQTVIKSSNATTFPIQLTHDMVPQAYILVSHITTKGALLSDYVLIHVDGSPFKNNVSASFSRDLLKPGQSVEMKIKADPNSTVYILSEDKKNRLLGTDNDISYTEIRSDVLGRDIDISDNIYSYPQPTNTHGKRDNLGRRMRTIHDGYGDVNDIFITLMRQFLQELSHLGLHYLQETGTIFLSDADVFDMKSSGDFLSDDATWPRKCFHITTTMPNMFPTPAPGLTYSPGFFPTFVPGMVPTPAPGFTYAPNNIPSNPQMALGTIVRSRFPETWIWSRYDIGSSGNLIVNLTVPDTITTWVTSVFATNDKTGFGLPDKTYAVTVKKDFFLTMDVPSTIVQGEEFLLQLTVFNYMSSVQQVFIQVVTTEDPNTPIPAATRVQPGHGHSTFLHITPAKFGILKIRAIAKAGFFTSTGTDTIEREVNVKPHGVHRETNEQHMIDLSPAGTLTPFSKTVSLKDVHNMVTGTKHTSVKITGNFMVPSIDGLDKLINMPYGCGEQTMLFFAPDIFVTKYLKTVGKLTPTIEAKTMKFMKSGLQRELTFQHRDGSFSAFGDRDAHGSSWLTAFVLKSFRQADGLIQIDNTIMTRALAWLMRFQHSDGSFYEPGRIIHTQMQAGTSSGLKLTAFILNAVLENRNTPGIDTTTVSRAIQNGKSYLENHFNSATDVYTLAIVCYSLTKSGSAYKPQCLQKLQATASIQDDKMYWEAKHPVTKRSVSPRAAKTRAPSADIEATAYNLLTLIELGETAKGLSVIKWLVSQRNPHGGFSSTQDTVISLQALSEFSSKHSTAVPNHNVMLDINSGSFHHSYSVTSANVDVVHYKEIPNSMDNVTLKATGQGVAVVDVTMSYYMTGAVGSTDIAVNSTLTHESLNSVTVKPCVSWQGGSDSGMIVMEVEMPTGFISDVDKLKSQNVIKKHEADGRVVALYFDGMSTGQSVCVEVKMDRSDPVVKSQACHITVYDYYNPITQAMTRYESGVLKSANICNVCPLCSFCQGSSGVGLIGVGK